jgi:hypothetical protein
MAVNVFEELARAALNAQGYFTFENAAYRLHGNARSLAGKDNPANTPSDIDLIGVAPRKAGPARVLAVNCKGGREPLMLTRDIDRILNGSGQTVAGSPSRQGFREFADDDWAKAFRGCVGALTGESSFTHVTVVRAFEGDRTAWTRNEVFMKRLTPNLALWSLDDILRKLRDGEARLNVNNSTLKLVDLLDRRT